jgi:hypothetical protein
MDGFWGNEIFEFSFVIVVLRVAHESSWVDCRGGWKGVETNNNQIGKKERTGTTSEGRLETL